jgi:hypothetical protein
MLTAVTVPPDCTVCEDVRTPAATSVRNSPVAAIAIVAPMDSFLIAISVRPLLSQLRSLEY